MVCNFCALPKHFVRRGVCKVKGDGEWGDTLGKAPPSEAQRRTTGAARGTHFGATNAAAPCEAHLTADSKRSLPLQHSVACACDERGAQAKAEGLGMTRRLGLQQTRGCCPVAFRRLGQPRPGIKHRDRATRRRPLQWYAGVAR